MGETWKHQLLAAKFGRTGSRRRFEWSGLVLAFEGDTVIRSCLEGIGEKTAKETLEKKQLLFLEKKHLDL